MADRAGAGNNSRDVKARRPLPAASPPSARRWIGRLALMIAMPVLLLGLTEGVLRLVGYGRPTTYFVPATDNPGRWVENPAFGRLFFPPGLLRVPPPTSFHQEKAPNTRRIFLFGESAAMGDPQPAFGVARYLEVLLRARHPESGWEVIPVAMTAISSHALVPMARQCASLDGDAWIVFAGNNEMIGPFGAGQALGRGPQSVTGIRLLLALRASRLGQAIENLTESLRSGTVGSSRWSGTRLFAGENIPAQDPRRDRVARCFESNLRAIVRAGRAAGVPVVISSVAVNLRDCAPFADAAFPAGDPARFPAWSEAWTSATNAWARGQGDLAGTAIARALEQHPGHASSQFLAGQVHLVSAPTEAVAALSRALDLDALPLRTDGRLNGLLRQVADASGAVWVDAAARLAESAPGGVPGKELFYEHVHFTPEGNHALAGELALALETVLPGLPNATRPDWLSAEACAERLGLSPWHRAAGAEVMLRRSFEAPFTQRWNHRANQEDLARLVNQYRRQQTPEAATEVRRQYAAALQAHPEDHLRHRSHAEFLEAVGDLPAAAQAWQQVIQLLPHHPIAYYHAGNLLRRLDRLDDARPLIAQAIALQPDWAEARLEEVALDLAAHRLDDALQHCRETLLQHPDHALAHQQLAEILGRRGERAAAVAALEKAVELNPRLFSARYLLGVEYAIDNRLDLARQHFAEVVRARPDHALARFNLGIALAKLQQWDDAHLHLSEALRLDPSNADARQALAQIDALRPRQPPNPNRP